MAVSMVLVFIWFRRSRLSVERDFHLGSKYSHTDVFDLEQGPCCLFVDLLLQEAPRLLSIL